MPERTFVEFAPAKINLTLRVIGRRTDGYHELESLVVFARPRDRIALAPGGALTLSVHGPTADKAGPDADNLILRASKGLSALVPDLKTGAFDLRKTLPVAAGIGGGSSDAAAALRCLARANGLSREDARVMAAAAKTGADVPVCLDPRPRIMRGIGDILSQAYDLPTLAAVLVNPRVAVPTADVFRALAAIRAKETSPSVTADTATSAVERAAQSGRALTAEELIDAVARSHNDLEGPAIAIQPIVAEVLAALRDLPGCKLARMSGSGATCFALFPRADAARAAQLLKQRRPGWWIQATVMGAG